MDQRDVRATAESADDAATEPAEAQASEATGGEPGEQTEPAQTSDRPEPAETIPAEVPTEVTADGPPTGLSADQLTIEQGATMVDSEREPTEIAIDGKSDESPPSDEQLPADQQPPAEEPAGLRAIATQSRAAAGPKPRTKLVCTIGPATVERIRELVEVGMDVARVNFSHGTPDEHKRAVDAVRAAAHSARRSVGVMVDLPGPKIRLGELAGGEIELEAGRTFLLHPPTGQPREGNSEGADVSHAGMVSDIQPGDRILLSDGAAELTVTGASNGTLETEVVRGGTVRSRGGVNVPSQRLTGGALTDADREAVPRALQLKADVIAQSFIRSAADVQELRALLPDGHSAPAIVAKIETRAAVEHFDEIAKACDGVMVARGDLGVDLPFEQVPLIQKDLLRRARNAGRFTIVATQMLESMTSSARPTRAEANDVANAVLDGTDAVMLSAETAIGKFPVEAAAAALSICAATERDGHDALTFPHSRLPANRPEAIIHAAVETSMRYSGLSAIWCFTRSGQTAERVSMLRPRLPVVAFTLTPTVARRLAVRAGVIPVVLPSARTGEPLVRRMEAAARAQGVSRSGAGGSGSSVLLVTTSVERGGINRLEIHEI